MSASKAFCRDKSKSFCHIGGSHYLKPFVFKSHSHHVANGGVVIHEQYLMGTRMFGRSHTTPPIFTNQCQHGLGICWKMYKSDQCSKLGNGNLFSVRILTRSWVSGGKPTFRPSRPLSFTVLQIFKSLGRTHTSSAFLACNCEHYRPALGLSFPP